MGPCRTHNENIRLHTERTPYQVEDQWSGLMKGGWWLERKSEGERCRDLWCWLSNTLSTVPNLELTQTYTGKKKNSQGCCIYRFNTWTNIVMFCFSFFILFQFLNYCLFLPYRNLKNEHFTSVFLCFFNCFLTVCAGHHLSPTVLCSSSHVPVLYAKIHPIHHCLQNKNTQVFFWVKFH